jgi:hypothetical protein
MSVITEIFMSNLQVHLLQYSFHFTDKLEKAWVQDTQLQRLIQWKFWWKWFWSQATCMEIDRVS